MLLSALYNRGWDVSLPPFLQPRMLTPGGVVGMGPLVLCQGRCTGEVLCKRGGLSSARCVQQQLPPSHPCSQEG